MHGPSRYRGSWAKTDFSGPYQQYPLGQPVPAQPARATGKQVLSACWAMLRQDRQMLWLPVMAAALGLAAAAILFVPGWAVGRAFGGGQWGWDAGVILAVFAASIVSTYFQAALVIAANERANGGSPTIGGVLLEARRLFRPIIAWALVTATVGLAIRLAEQRLGVLGKIAGLLGGLAWGIASFLAIPVVVAEGLGPFAAVKRSADLIRTTWGTGLRTTLRFGFIQFLVILPVLIVAITGVAFLVTGSVAGIAGGVVLVGIAVLALLVLGAVLGAVSGYARTMIYRYATGQPVPGIPAEAFAGVFMPKRGRRR